MKIESPSFKHGQPIPVKHTCKGQDISPELHFLDVPAKTVSLALIVDDPDAPMGTFDHWIAWNIPGSTRQLAEGERLSHQGRNGYQVQSYRGPCPPPGKVHRYFFKLYALDTELSLPNGISKAQLEASLEGHILAKAELIGTFIKQ